MPPYTGEPSHSEQVVLAIAPKIAAGLSLIGSSYIIFDIIRGKNIKKRTTYHRLIVGLSLCDILMSAGLFTSTWPMPKDTEFVYGARGNTQSCEIVGFIEQSGVAAVIYNASLSFYYLLRIRNGVPAEKIEGCIEFWMHFVPLAFGLTTMIVGLPLKLYNSGIFDCWIASFPLGCKESWLNGGVTDCVRGDNASVYQWILDFIPKFTAIIIVTINMFTIYCSVYKQEKAAYSHSFEEEIRKRSKSFRGSFTLPNTGNSEQLDMGNLTVNVARPKMKLSKQLARQSFWYVGALYLCWFPCFITRATQLATGVTYYEMLLWISISIPLQGFFNVCVYLRPRYIEARQQEIQKARIHGAGNDDSSEHPLGVSSSSNNDINESVISFVTNCSGGFGNNNNVFRIMYRSIVESLVEGELPEEDLGRIDNEHNKSTSTTSAISTNSDAVSQNIELPKSEDSREEVQPNCEGAAMSAAESDDGSEILKLALALNSSSLNSWTS